MKNDWRAAGERARLSVVKRAMPDPERDAVAHILEKTAALAASADRLARAQDLQQLAEELRAIERRVQAEVKINAAAIGSYALGLERAAEHLDGHRP